MVAGYSAEGAGRALPWGALAFARFSFAATLMAATISPMVRNSGRSGPNSLGLGCHRPGSNSDATRASSGAWNRNVEHMNEPWQGLFAVPFAHYRNTRKR